MIPDWASERRRLVRALRKQGIQDERVLSAVGEIPREVFVPEELRVLSYVNDPVSIGYGQTISQPYMIALMAESLALTGAERILDIGAGSGYHSAILAHVGRDVYAIEILPELATRARRNLERVHLGGKVIVLVGDGSEGYETAAPFDAISVAAGAPDVPPALLDQLNDPGRLVIPVGPLEDQLLLLVTKRDGRVQRRIIAHCRFVPLRGQEGWK